MDAALIILRMGSGECRTVGSGAKLPRLFGPLSFVGITTREMRKRHTKARMTSRGVQLEAIAEISIPSPLAVVVVREFRFRAVQKIHPVHALMLDRDRAA